ncbi:hypothetical protein QV06_10600 [Gallibacterium genomosp. 3]|uniref:Uncharacterized protein n=1 Tax=Gallibacterium genomosp. 3 TaxID=505345 RepID=A0A1A7PKD8_9PAST|nr:hypothetical protein [Gallibacterium genomosp. 3]OBX02983.1 hypothetical protein QV06_10600 [Gallibacterium genomosp. 3]
MKKFIFYCLVFTWLFNIKYNFIPLHPSVTMGVIGAGLLLRDYLRKQWMAYQVAPLSLMVIPFILSIFPAKLINPASMEIAYVIQNGITPVIYLFAAYFLYHFAVVVYGNVNYQRLSGIWINVVVIQSVLTLCVNLLPFMQDLLLFLIRYSEGRGLIVASLEQGNRFIGFGTQFFGSGIIYAFTIILLAFRLAQQRIGLPFIRDLVLLAFISLVGLLLARTVLVGIAIGAVIFCYQRYFTNYYRLAWFCFLLIPTALLLLLIFLYAVLNNLLGIDLLHSKLFYFAAELFINLFSGAGLETESTDILLEMYQILPTTLATWLIGDGFYLAQNSLDGLYYMGTDVGYLRIIFAVGLVGLIVNLMTHSYLTAKIMALKPQRALLYFALLTLYFILLIKGMVSFIALLGYFYLAELAEVKNANERA